MRRPSLLYLPLALFLAWPSVGRAQSPDLPTPSASANDRAQALYLEGMTLYRSGKYRSAVGRFREAFGLVPDPRLMYNIGRSYEAVGDLDTAERWYRRCAEDAETKPALQQKARRRIRIVERARRRSALAPPDAAPPAPMQVEAAPPPSDSGALTTSKWLTGALGLGVLGGGAALFTLGLLDESDLDDSRTDPGTVSSRTRVDAADLAAQAEDKQLAGIIMLGAGAALAVTSMILFIVDADDDTDDAGLDESGLGVSVVPYNDGGGVWLTTSF